MHRAPPENQNPAPLAEGGYRVIEKDRLGGSINGRRNKRSLPNCPAAKARFFWCRILDAVAEQRDALDYRIRCGDPADNLLEADCKAWCELSCGLADFLEARRVA